MIFIMFDTRDNILSLTSDREFSSFPLFMTLIITKPTTFAFVIESLLKIQEKWSEK